MEQQLEVRVQVAVDILKSTHGDRWTMMSVSERLKLDLSHDLTLDQMVKKMAAHALDVLTGEREIR